MNVSSIPSLPWVWESEYLGEEHPPYKSRCTGCSAVSQAEIGQDPSTADERPKSGRRCSKLTPVSDRQWRGSFPNDRICAERGRKCPGGVSELAESKFGSVTLFENAFRQLSTIAIVQTRSFPFNHVNVQGPH